MSRIRATVVIPTTGDRGSLLPYSIGSVLDQTVENLEVFVIGDGLNPEGQEVVRELARDDERVKLFAFPKGDRRGELNRHQVLTEHADSEIVTYLCDRDLYLPHHLEVMLKLLDDADFAYSMRFRMMIEDTINPGRFPDLVDPKVRVTHRPVVPLSFGGHRLDSYRRLPYGWRTTPEDRGTDGFMWEQFFDQDWCSVAASVRPTVLTFKRGPYPGWPTEERRRILEKWQPRLDEPDLETALTTGILEAHVRQASAYSEQNRRHRTRRSTLAGQIRSVGSLAKLRYQRIKNHTD